MKSAIGGQILDEVLLRINEKCMNTFPPMDELQSGLGSLDLIRKPVLEKENWTRLKITLCHILSVGEGWRRYVHAIEGWLTSSDAHLLAHSLQRSLHYCSLVPKKMSTLGAFHGVNFGMIILQTSPIHSACYIIRTMCQTNLRSVIILHA